MKKRVAVYSIYLVFVVLAIGFLYVNNENMNTSDFNKLSAYAIYSKAEKRQIIDDTSFLNYPPCIETDRGYDWYFAGEAYYADNLEHFKDSCVTRIKLKEYYCQDGRLKYWIATCPYGYTCMESKCQVDLNWYTWNYAYLSHQGVPVESYTYTE